MSKYNDFGKCMTERELSDYFRDRKYGHTNFCHYTSLKVINSILKNNRIWLSSVDGLNDKNDTSQFCVEDLQVCSDYFILCLSTGIHENLSLWYLYSGIEGKGGRIRVNQTGIRKIKDCMKLSLCVAKEDNIIRTVRELNPVSDYDLSFRDVIYYEYNKDDTVSCKYNNLTNWKCPSKAFDELKDKEPGFAKKIIWYYEKEERLVCKLKGPAHDLIQSKLSDGEKYVVCLRFDDSCLKHMRVDLAPGIANLSDVPREFDAIWRLIESKAVVRTSMYKDEIKFNLVSERKDRIFSTVKEVDGRFRTMEYTANGWNMVKE